MFLKTTDAKKERLGSYGTIFVFKKKILSMRLLFLLLLISGSLFSQGENALPPGPATISGKVVDKTGEGVKGATLTVLYKDGKQRPCDTFYSNSDGYFTAYVFREDQDYVDLEIKINGLLCKIIPFNGVIPGCNLGHPFNQILCPIKN